MPARPPPPLSSFPRQDGRYEPVSGRVDPTLPVREMYTPLSDLLDDKPKK